MTHDTINHPAHYTSHPSGVECITITEPMGLNLGNAMAYIWRAYLKERATEDLCKARWYLEREIARLRASGNPWFTQIADELVLSVEALDAELAEIYAAIDKKEPK